MKIEAKKGKSTIKVKNVILLSIFSSQKRPFLDILNKEECFLDQKSEALKQSKNNNFAKGLVQAFCQKFKLFVNCVSGEIKPEKIVFGYFEMKKKRFLDQKSEV